MGGGVHSAVGGAGRTGSNKTIDAFKVLRAGHI